MSEHSATSEQSTKNAPRLLRSSAIVSVATMLSRVLGLVRDVVFAVFIGAAGGADAFFVAFKIPNFLRRLFAEGAFAQAFVPVLSELRQQHSLADVKHFIDRVFGCLGLSVLVVSAIAVLVAPLITWLFAPGFYSQSADKYELTVDLIRITFPYLAFISLAGFAGSILNSYDRFAVPALTPVILNLVLISFAVWLSPMFERPVMALAWGVLVAGALQFSFQLPFLARIHLMPVPVLDWKDSRIRQVLKLMAPALFGVSVSQINLLLDTILASLINDGSVSWLYYSDRLIELPLGVFGIAIATVILPALSRQHADASEHYSATLDWALRSVLFIAVPASAALVVLAEPIIVALFLHGDKFTAHSALMASYSLMAYALGLCAFMLIKVLITGYFSRKDTRTPVKVGVVAMISNMAFNIAFLIPFEMLWQVGHVGLALATSASAFLNAAMLFWGLYKGGFFQPQSGWVRYLILLGLASAVMVLGLVVAQSYLGDLSAQVWWLRVLNVLGLCALGFVLYLICMVLGGWRPRHLKPAF